MSIYTSLSDYQPIADGSALNTEIFRKALADIAQRGGGTLHIAPGKYLTGNICLYDNTYLYLSAGAELIASPDYDDFRDAKSEVAAENSHHGFIFAKNRSNVGILGHGMLNGNASQYHAAKADSLGYLRPEEKRIRTGIFENCRHITIEGITIVDSAMWTLHFISCEYGRIENVNILNNFKYSNSDAIDIDGCSHFHIHGCNLQSADDGICLKTSRKKTRLHRSCENILVENCIIESHSSALKIGTESYHDFINIKFSNILIIKSNRGIALVLRDGGKIRGVTFDNISIENEFSKKCHWGRSDSIYLSVKSRDKDTPSGDMKDIYFSNIKIKSKGAINLHAEKPDLVANIHMFNVRSHQIGSFDPDRGTYDLRPPCNPYQKDNTGMNNAYVMVDGQTRPWGVYRYPNGLPAVYIDNIKREAVKFDNCRFTQEDGFSWHAQLIVFTKS